MKLVNIKWIIDAEEVIEAIRELLDNHPDNYIIEFLDLDEVYFKKYCLSDNDKLDYIFDRVRHCPALENKLFNLPDEVELPEEIADFDDDFIASWLSDTYGFCHEGFNYENEEVSK